MSDFYFNETHGMVRDSVRKFIRKEILPHVEEWEEAGSFPREVYRQAAAAGILGIGYPEEYGGTGYQDIFMKVAASEELMRSTSGGLVASLGSLDIALPPILKWGSAELKDRIIPPVLSGEKIAALAITEPGGGSDVASLKTTAVKENGHYRVNGSKTFITSGIRADYYTVAVRTGGESHGGISLLVIEKGTPGFSVGRNLKKMGWWASDTAELFFDDCKVPVDNLIGMENTGFFAIMSNFLMERIALTIMAYQTAQVALEKAIEYSRSRRAFGREIGRYQVTRHKLVDMATRTETARQFSYSLCARIATGENPVKEVSMLKNVAVEACEFVTREAIQIYGGMGYMRESGMDRLYRDARLLAIGGGTTEIMKEIIARQMSL